MYLKIGTGFLTPLMRERLLARAGSSRILLALDSITVAEMTTLAEELAEVVAGGKVTDLIDQAGVNVLCDTLFKIKFLDPKINDIENTVRNRLQHYDRADIVTVHASMSEGALKAASLVAKEKNFACVAVTVLTNISNEECVSIFGSAAEATVIRFVKRAKEVGLAGVVCSPHEATLVRELWPEALIITPGVRSAHASKGDQARTTTPAEAINNGAWQPYFVSAHNDLWRGNVLNSKSTKFVLIDWDGITLKGYAFYDLVRVAGSFKLNKAKFQNALQQYCDVMGCNKTQAKYYLISAFAFLHANLGDWQYERFLILLNDCMEYFETNAD